jgi:hypothetical protein
VVHDEVCGELPLGLARRWDRWRLEACRKRVRADAEALAQCLETQTGRPCSAEALLAATRS